MNTSYDAFVKAFRAKTEHGDNTKIAHATGVTPKYIGDILKGRRKAAHSLQEKISSALGLTYEGMLAMGRQMLNVETMPPASDPADDQHVNYGPDLTPEEEAHILDQTRYVIRAKHENKGALISNVRAFYNGVKREEEMEGMRDRLKNVESLLMELVEEKRARALPEKKSLLLDKWGVLQGSLSVGPQKPLMVDKYQGLRLVRNPSDSIINSGLLTDRSIKRFRELERQVGKV